MKNFNLEFDTWSNSFKRKNWGKKRKLNKFYLLNPFLGYYWNICHGKNKAANQAKSQRNGALTLERTDCPKMTTE